LCEATQNKKGCGNVGTQDFSCILADVSKLSDPSRTAANSRHPKTRARRKQKELFHSSRSPSHPNIISNPVTA